MKGAKRSRLHALVVVAATVPVLIGNGYPALAADSASKSDAGTNVLSDNKSFAGSNKATSATTASASSSTAPTTATATEATTSGARDAATENVTPAQVDDNTPLKPKKKIIFKPGMPLTINTANENIKVTNDSKLAREQAQSFPDSPEAHFVLAVALTRTSQVEEALKEIRVARKLASQKGGAAYFDQMINEYENMLEYYPEDNQVRYHLAWAYYMKAYVLARYSKKVKQESPTAMPKPVAPTTIASADAAKDKTAVPSTAPQAPETPESLALKEKRTKDWHTDWVAQGNVLKEDEVAPDSAKSTTDGGSVAKVPEAATPLALDHPAAAPKPQAKENFWSNPMGALSTMGPITGMDYAVANAAPEVIPQIKGYYRRALKKLDEVLAKEPNDLWARLYRAHLGLEYSGDIESAMKVWESCREEYPNNPAPYFFLGEGYLKKGDLRQCLSNVSRAIALRSVGN
ncbi:MAG: tetratricopeptide repeat protein [Candidatus Obscuribacterales bacterium]|nr:tetratricopeptide repeat protein [Candidatus Obscuribacterales bacterium]